MIRLENIAAAYGERRVLEPLSLAIQPGETLVLAGPNSAGKSTLLKILGGLLTPVSGTVHLLDRPLAAWSLKERARVVAWVPSEADFVFSYSVQDVVLLGRTPYAVGNQAPTPRDYLVAREMLELTDLSALADRPVDALSSGERQRVLLARALTQEPSLLLLDEPTAHLDLGHSDAFFSALARLRQLRPLTIVLATHDLELAKRVGSRVLLLKEGRVHGMGAPVDLLTPETIHAVFKIHTPRRPTK